MRICSKCWEKDCCHGDRYKIEIDDDIIETIICLNKKGYSTVYCCSGHDRMPTDIYITFSRWSTPDIDTNKIGKFWKYTKYNCTLRAVLPHGIKTVEGTHIFLEERRVELGRWAEELEAKVPK